MADNKYQRVDKELISAYITSKRKEHPGMPDKYFDDIDRVLNAAYNRAFDKTDNENLIDYWYVHWYFGQRTYNSKDHKVKKKKKKTWNGLDQLIKIQN